MRAPRVATHSVLDDDACGIAPRRAADAAARMRAGAAQIQTRQRRAVITPARHRPETEQLMQRHRAMKDVAAGQRETSFEFERRQQLAMQDRCAEIWRIDPRSEEHTSELQSLMRNSYAVFCLKQKKQYN